MSKWFNSQTQNLKTKAGEIESTIDYKVKNAQDKIVGLIAEEEEAAHRVSKYNWKRKMFKFRGTLHHGIPGTPTVIAYDSIQKIMAIGTTKGLVKVFGKPGVEVVVNQYEGSISHLCFATNRGKLLIVYKGGCCACVNLESKRSSGSYIFKGVEVNTLLHIPNTDFILVGLNNGNIHILSTANKLALSTYRISGRSALLVDKNSEISSLALHPTQPNILLIAHDCGTLSEWNLVEEKCIFKYNPIAGNRGSLNAIAWHPDGNKFAVGYKNGDIFVWIRNENQPNAKSIIITEHPNTPRRPIKKLCYSQLHGIPILFSFGGTSMSHEPDTVAIRYNDHVTILPPKSISYGEKSSKLTVVDSIISHSNPFPFTTNPCNIILVTSSSNITVYYPARGKFQDIIPSPNFRLQTSRITSTLFTIVSHEFLNDISSMGKISWKSSNWPIIGGSSSIQPHTNADILITGHLNGCIFFWDMSNTHFNLLYVINILNDIIPENSSIISIDLCVESRILCASCLSGETLVYNFSNNSLKISKKQKKLILKQLQLHDQRKNIYINDNISIKQQSIKQEDYIRPSSDPRSEIKSTVTTVTTERSRKPKSQKSSHETLVNEFSWKQFFINANIDKTTAVSYAEFFDKEKITTDLIKDLDQDMMEMAGITSVGDKMRILKYIKNDYLINDKESSSVPVTRKKTKKRTKRKTSKPVNSLTNSKENNIIEKESELTSPPSPIKDEIITDNNQSMNIIDNHSSKKSSKKKKIIPPNEIPPGYQLKAECSFPNRITQIKIASSLSKIATGDHCGNVALLDITSGNVLLHKSLGDDKQSPVTWLCFDDRAVIQKEIKIQKRSVLKKNEVTKTSTMVEPGLFVGLEDGRLFYIALRTGQVDHISIPGSEQHSYTLSSVLLLDGTGAPVIPKGISWRELLNPIKEEIIINEEDDNEEFELVIKNLDEERSSPIKESPTVKDVGEIPISDRKFLLVCAGKMIIIYSLPAYSVYSTLSCDKPPESANVVERDGNYCLIVFFASGDLKILTLMDLLEIKTIPNALQQIGVQFESKKLKSDINCTTDGRFVILSKYQEVIRGSLFTDENL